jgi:amino acid adenylation domain-containing protein
MPISRLSKIFSNLGPDMVITDDGLIPTLLECGISEESVLLYDKLIETEIDQASINRALRFVKDTDPVYIMYTSGSTGTPKGVVIPHKGVIDYIDWVTETFNVNNHTVIGNQSPFYFDNTVLDIYACVKTGARLVIIPEAFFKFQAKLPDYLNLSGINFIFWVPTVYINIANSGVLNECSLNGIKTALFCGEVMPNKQLNIWRETQPHIKYANLYGPTEITDVCAYYIVDRDFEDADPLPIGVPCENMGIIILNEENAECAVSETGELCVMGTGLALGYYRQKDLTDKAFIQNPLNDKYMERMYRTGDLAYKTEDGLIMFVGRLDSQIKHRGNRIELGEIENAARNINGVSNACVVYDNDSQQIVLFLEKGEGLNIKSIRKTMLNMVPQYMLPNKTVILDSFPYTANKKIDRVALKLTLSDK